MIINTGIYIQREQLNTVESKHTQVGTLYIYISDVEQAPQMNRITITTHAPTQAHMHAHNKT